MLRRMSGRLTKEKAAKRYKWVRKVKANAETMLVDPVVSRVLKREKTRHHKSMKHLVAPVGAAPQA